MFFLIKNNNNALVKQNEYSYSFVAQNVFFNSWANKTQNAYKKRGKIMILHSRSIFLLVLIHSDALYIFLKMFAVHSGIYFLDSFLFTFFPLDDATKSRNSKKKQETSMNFLLLHAIQQNLQLQQPEPSQRLEVFPTEQSVVVYIFCVCDRECTP